MLIDSMFQPSVLQKIGATCGFAVPLVAFGCIGAAIISYPEFSWMMHALSDLGVASGIAAPFFNLGLVAAGLLCFFFAALGLFRYFKSSVVGKIGAVVFAMAGIWLMAIGIIHMGYGIAHLIAAILFFISLPVSFCVLTIALYQRQETKLAAFTLFSSFAAVAPWILYAIVPYAPNIAIPETLSSIAGAVWIVVISYRILKTAKV